jgi:hypothetical protein
MTVEPPRVPIHVERTEVNIELDHLDVRELCRRFSVLFDRASIAVQRMGLDLDEVILERYALLDLGQGAVIRVKAEPLSDGEKLIALFRAAVRVTSPMNGRVPSAQPKIRLVALIVEVLDEDAIG